MSQYCPPSPPRETYRVVADGTRDLPYPATIQWEAFYAMRAKDIERVGRRRGKFEPRSLSASMHTHRSSTT